MALDHEQNDKSIQDYQVLVRKHTEQLRDGQLHGPSLEGTASRRLVRVDRSLHRGYASPSGWV